MLGLITDKPVGFVKKDGYKMYPLIPVHSAAGLLELVCYGFTIVAALASCLFHLR
ncbi:MAG: hypothetical protein R3C99_25440 [Pirellulaceae bacterium]|nr:hypothetical protein [Planctomycetales bacterium]MCA9224961.1 hypothetical protein [Planctomycetales bacterium]